MSPSVCVCVCCVHMCMWVCICVSSASLISDATRTCKLILRMPCPSVFNPGFLVTFAGEWNSNSRSGCNLYSFLKEHHCFWAHSANGTRECVSCVQLFATPCTVAHQSPPSMEFSRQEYWSGLPFPSPGDLPDPGIEHRSPALQADALPSEPPEKPRI